MLHKIRWYSLALLMLAGSCVSLGEGPTEGKSSGQRKIGFSAYYPHIGLDLSSVFHQITFAPSIGDWETKIYEQNDDF